MEQSIRLLVTVSFLVIGISHMVQPRAWGEFFDLLRRHGRAGCFANAFLTFVPGVIIVAFHRVWSGLDVVFTVLGCLYVVKGAIYFWLPEVGLRSMARATAETSRGFVWAGLAMTAVGVFFAFRV
ncbi:MAG: hypothetical protein GY711_10130 [bacterium]|nr:hypothetical protein [bacterium]